MLVPHTDAAAPFDVLPVPFGRLEVVFIIGRNAVQLAHGLGLQLDRPGGKALVSPGLHPLIDILLCAFQRGTVRVVRLNIFDKIFLSYEEGYVKSNIEAFINVEKKLNIKAENILFIDNNENNINNAKKRGWNTCLAFGYELDKIKNTVDEFLKI